MVTYVAFGDNGRHAGAVVRMGEEESYQSAQPWSHCSTILCEGTETECVEALAQWEECSDPYCYTHGLGR